MGEIADAMLDGTLCEGCGTYLGSGLGFVTLCAACNEPEGKPTKTEKVACPKCKKKIKSVGINDHMRDVHGKKKANSGK